jgi:outer membrane protein assembly factor BamB
VTNTKERLAPERVNNSPAFLSDSPSFPRSITFTLLAASLIVAAVEARADDWPGFLGPHANNTSAETGLIDKWPAPGPSILWSKPVGTGYSAPSTRSGKLVLHHRLKDEEIVECFDPATGESRWRYAYRSRFIDPYGYNNGPRCTPLLTSNLCYTFGAEGKLLCLRLDTGKLVWERDTAKDWQVPEAFFGVGSTPLLEGERLIVMVGGQPNSGVVALDPKKTLGKKPGRALRHWAGAPRSLTTGRVRKSRRATPLRWP